MTAMSRSPKEICRAVGGLPVLAAIGLVVLRAGLCPEKARAATPDDIAGVWLTDDGKGAIEILPCGEQRCGRIVWMKDNEDSGRIPTDQNNHDASLRSRPICGLMIITGLNRQSDGSWSGGRVYNPDNGETYDMEVRHVAPDTLKVTGYLGLKLFGESMNWQRAPKNLGTCSVDGFPQPGRDRQKGGRRSQG